MGSGTVGVAPGTSTFRLSDGTVVALADWSDVDHWSTIDITAGNVFQAQRAFGYGRAQQVAGSTRCASQVDTSIPRPGWVGLPQHHEFIVYSWRAMVIGPQAVIESDAAQVWFATTSARFDYAAAARAYMPLAELMRVINVPFPTPEDFGQPQAQATTQTATLPHPAAKLDPMLRPQFGKTWVLPVRMRENLAYGVEIEPCNPRACEAFSKLLAETDTTLMLRVFLSGLYKTPTPA